MSEIFAVTSGWANYFVRTEPFHQAAKQLMQQWHKDQTRIITTNYVLSELVALFISPLRIPRSQQIQAIDTIKSVDWIEIIHIDQKLNDQAWRFLKERDDSGKEDFIPAFYLNFFLGSVKNIQLFFQKDNFEL